MAEKATATPSTEQASGARVTGVVAPSVGGAEQSQIPYGLLQLQRAAGNLAAGRLLSGVLQAKLRIGAAGDAHEREADRMADKVLRMPTAGDGGMIGRVSDVPVQRVCSECDDELQRQPLEEEEEEELAQRAATSADGGGEAPSSVQSQISTLRGRGQPLSPSLRSFFEPRFNHDFGGVRVHTGSTAAASAQSIKARAFTVGRDIAFNAGQYAPQSRSGRRLLAHELTHVVQQTPLVARRTPLIQRQPEPAAQQEAPAPEPEQSPATPEAAPVAEEGAASEATPAPGLLVEDGESELGPGQLTKSTFLAELRTGICSAADTELADTAFSAQGCPTIELYLRFYEALSAARIEQDLVNYVPEAAGVTDARQYIPFAAARVQRSVASWVQTGEITGVPEGLPTGLPGLSALAGVLFKARPGGPRGNANPQAVQTQLGAGRPLNSTVNSRMGSAFGRSFSNVRVHTDSTARRLNSRHNARAFTVGNHVAFGAGEYRPGTIVGDALIAHELAHTVQQRNTDNKVAPLEMGSSATTSLEKDADRSAVGVMASLWGGAKRGLESIAPNPIPRLRSGLSLSRCSNTSTAKKSVTVNVTFLDQGSTALTAHLATANVVFGQANVEVKSGNKKTLNATESKAILGADLILDEFTNPSNATAEEKALFKENRTGGSITMYYVKGMSAGSLGEAFYPATGNPVGFVYASSNSRTWPHELGHVLLDTGGHPSDANNFMAQTSVATGKELMTESQKKKIRGSGFVT